MVECTRCSIQNDEVAVGFKYKRRYCKIENILDIPHVTKASGQTVTAGFPHKNAYVRKRTFCDIE